MTASLPPTDASAPPAIDPVATASPARESEAILAAARASLANQRAGGRRATGSPSARAEAPPRGRGVWRIVLMLLLVLLAADLASSLLGTILGEAGLLLIVAAVVAVGWLMLRQPRGVSPPPPPTGEALREAPLPRLIDDTQRWLEAQRPALPATAARPLAMVRARLDALQPELARLSDNQPVAVEVRRLVAEHLPEVVSAYTAIPASLRGEKHGGPSPDETLATSLGLIGDEIDAVTRQLAQGAIDRLAIQTRYLDLKYGESHETGIDGGEA